ncbi:MAG: hypothetical protein HY691_01305, partial [Chloroflexi bacterium]|nr:hypothetical protein [Chloroflexota bacterium]
AALLLLTLLAHVGVMASPLHAAAASAADAPRAHASAGHHGDRCGGCPTTDPAAPSGDRAPHCAMTAAPRADLSLSAPAAVALARPLSACEGAAAWRPAAHGPAPPPAADRQALLQVFRN